MMLLHDCLTESAARSGETVALIQGNRRVSYGELEEMSTRVAGYLQGRLRERGERVGLFMGNSPEYAASLFAVLRAGGIAVPLGDQATARGLKNLLADFEPTVLFAEERLLPRAFEALRDNRTVHAVVVAGGGAQDAICGQPPDYPGNPAVRMERFADILSAAGPNIAVEGIRDTDAAMIIYTSGTTGAPKGVTLSHRNLCSNARSIVQYLKLTSEDRAMTILPFYYSYGNSLLTTHVMAGGSLVLENSFMYPNTVLEKMAQHEVTGFSGVPSTYAILLNRSNLRNYRFPKLRYITQAGGAMSPKHALELRSINPELEIYIMYGQTEATARLTYLEPSELTRKAGSIGKPIPGVRITVKREDGTVAGLGETGEIVAEGDNIMLGYWRKPEETSEVLKVDGLHTGDHARVDAEGYLYIVGRRTDFIKSGAHRIGAKEIEEILLEIEEVDEVAVVGVEDEILGEALRACIVVKPGRELGRSAVMAHCKENLPPYKVPREISFLDALPKTTTGKIRKQELSGKSQVAKP